MKHLLLLAYCFLFLFNCTGTNLVKTNAMEDKNNFKEYLYFATDPAFRSEQTIAWHTFSWYILNVDDPLGVNYDSLSVYYDINKLSDEKNEYTVFSIEENNSNNIYFIVINKNGVSTIFPWIKPH